MLSPLEMDGMDVATHSQEDTETQCQIDGYYDGKVSPLRSGYLNCLTYERSLLWDILHL